MKPYVNFAELYHSPSGGVAKDYPAMSDNLSDSPVPHKEVIVRYLKRGGRQGGMTPCWITDVFTGEMVRGVSDNGREDDEYCWSEQLAYYVERYDLMLPEDFVAHILSESGVSG